MTQQLPSYPPRPMRARHLDESTEEMDKPWWKTLGEIITVLIVALVVASIVKTFFVQAYYVPSGSMETTLMPGDRITVNRLARSEDKLSRGDIVVFADPNNWLSSNEEESSVSHAFKKGLEIIGILPMDSGKHLVKRIIGMSGDHVVCCTTNGKITVNGKEIDETYLDEGIAPSLENFDVTVPQGYVWVMGDNRSNSKDSRYHQKYEGNGFVPVDHIMGRTFAVYFPFDRFQRVHGAQSVFADVPSPDHPLAQPKMREDLSSNAVFDPHN